MVRWGMVIDLRKCIGCLSCTTVCTETNKLPGNIWRRVLDCGVSGSPERQRTSLPMNCMHCSEPSCLKVCPTTATYQRSDCIVDINYERCVGCGYCIVACPYEARSIIEVEEKSISQESDKTNSRPDRTGVCTKCNFCLPRVDAGLAEGLQPGLDSEASPVCVNTCVSNALHFGNLDDPDSEVSQLIRENKTLRLQEECGTDPSVYYIIE